MQSKHLVFGLTGVWLVLFVASFVVVRAVAPEDDDFARRLSRIASFLSWQVSALIVATITATVTQRLAARGTEGVKLVGYVPLAMSVFVVVSFIGIVAYRVYVRPLLA
jgi:uncharacterized membrane protein